VVLSEPLNGDFQEGIVIGRMELQARSEASSVWGINAERLRHRVSPKTTPIRPPLICRPLLKGYRKGMDGGWGLYLRMPKIAKGETKFGVFRLFTEIG
jgi:hypothetical protein